MSAGVEYRYGSMISGWSRHVFSNHISYDENGDLKMLVPRDESGSVSCPVEGSPE